MFCVHWCNFIFRIAKELLRSPGSTDFKTNGKQANQFSISISEFDFYNGNFMENLFDTITMWHFEMWFRYWEYLKSRVSAESELKQKLKFDNIKFGIYELTKLFVEKDITI